LILAVTQCHTKIYNLGINQLIKSVSQSAQSQQGDYEITRKTPVTFSITYLLQIEPRKFSNCSY